MTKLKKIIVLDFQGYAINTNRSSRARQILRENGYRVKKSKILSEEIEFPKHEWWVILVDRNGFEKEVERIIDLARGYNIGCEYGFHNKLEKRLIDEFETKGKQSRW